MSDQKNLVQTYFLELFDCTLVDTAALVDQVTCHSIM